VGANRVSEQQKGKMIDQHHQVEYLPLVQCLPSPPAVWSKVTPSSKNSVVACKVKIKVLHIIFRRLY
jgi:hypothetical protein